MRPARRTWRSSTIAFGSPFAWAVRTKSWLITSIMTERVMRAMMAAFDSPSVSAGRTRLSGPVPATGSHWSSTAKKNSSSRPSQKCGIETPAIASVIKPVSSGAATLVGGEKPERHADQRPPGSWPRTASTSVFGRRWRIRSSTGCWPRIVLPRSPCSRRPTKRTYCSGIGLVEAERVADRLELLGRRALALRIHDLHRIARHEMDQQRDRDGGHEDREHPHRDALADECPHGSIQS